MINCLGFSYYIWHLQNKLLARKMGENHHPKYFQYLTCIILFNHHQFNSVQFTSDVQSCPTLWPHESQHARSLSITNSRSLLKLTSIELVMDIQPSHPLLSPSPLASSPSQHQVLFQWVSSSHQVAKGLEFQLQHQSFQWIFRTDFLQDGLVGSPCCPSDSQESSPTPQFKSINSSVLSFLHSPTLTSVHDH